MVGLGVIVWVEEAEVYSEAALAGAEFARFDLIGNHGGF